MFYINSGYLGCILVHQNLTRTPPGTRTPPKSTHINFGPRVVCWAHRDWKNLAWGWCVVLVLGRFNGKLGGHIVLHEPKLVIEVWPGAIVFLPSASITHSNIPLASEEDYRFSVVLYSAAEIFRWLKNGGRSLQDIWEREGEGAAKRAADGVRAWEEGVGRFRSLEGLMEYWERQSGPNTSAR